MINEPRIITTEAQPVAVIHVTVAADEIQQVMGPARQELVETVKAQNVETIGAWFTHHLRRPGETFDFEVGVVVRRPITQARRVRPSEWPAMGAARTVYRGGYDGLGNAWSEFLDWLGRNGHATTQDLWERYSVGHEASDNPLDWQTELTQPLRN